MMAIGIPFIKALRSKTGSCAPACGSKEMSGLFLIRHE